MNLTNNQRRAITQPVGNLQLIACAGSGKTEVVARRIVHLLTPGRPDSLVPANIVAFSVLREAELEEANLTGCSVVDGLEMYRTLLDERSYLDYSSILETAVEVLTNDDGLRQRLSERVKYVIVDEYQDVNPVQEA